MTTLPWLPDPAPAPDDERAWVGMLDLLETRAIIKATVAIGGMWPDDFGDQPQGVEDVFAWRDAIISCVLSPDSRVVQELKAARVWAARAAVLTPLLAHLLSGDNDSAVRRALYKNVSYRNVRSEMISLLLKDLDGIPARALRAWRQMPILLEMTEGKRCIEEQWTYIWGRLLDLDWRSLSMAEAAAHFAEVVPWMTAGHLVALGELVLEAHSSGARVAGAFIPLARHPKAQDFIARLLLSYKDDDRLLLLLAAEPSLAALPLVREAMAPLKTNTSDPTLLEAFLVGCEGSDDAEWRYHIGSLLDIDIERAARIVCSVPMSLAASLPDSILVRLSSAATVRELAEGAYGSDTPESYVRMAQWVAQRGCAAGSTGA